MMNQKTEATERLLEVMDRLREECPWDRKQTFETLRHNTIEEVYELSEAILNGDMEGIKEELGDVLLHVVFYAKIAEESGAFDFANVANALCDKLIYRHPHIYGDVIADTSEEVKANWEALKLRKKELRVARSGEGGGLLSGVPAQLPSLVKAVRLGEKAAAAGFDWEKPSDVWEKVQEEIHEIEAEIVASVDAPRVSECADAAPRETPERLEGEFGDLFFALAQACRLYGVDPDAALERTNKKFISRFNHMESHAAKPMREYTSEELENLWQDAKK